MNAQALCTFLEAEFGKTLIREDLITGYAFYWRVVNMAPTSSRLIRITQTREGNIAEIKLAQSSIAADNKLFLPLPARPDEVAAAIHLELARLLKR